MVDLTGFKLTFSEEFNTRSISQTGQSTTWSDIRSEWRFDKNSDIGFSNTSFVDASSGYDPFKVADGTLSISAVRDTTPFGYAGSWESGLIHTKNSFSQTYGYFEMRADLASTPGSWDAFWLLPVAPGAGTGSGWQELDVVEHYGDNDKGVYRWLHTTDPHSNPSATLQVYSEHAAQVDGFHTYGMMWTADTISFYFDGALIGSKATPSDMHGPMYILADLATTATANSSSAPITTKIDYIRAFSGEATAVAVSAPIVSAPDGRDPGLYGAISGGTPSQVSVGGGVLLPEVHGTSADDQLKGTTGNDRIWGEGGNDTLNGGNGDDSLSGGDGHDVLWGGNGQDTLLGGAGNDTLYGEAGNDTADAGAGNDSVWGGAGNDLIDGSGGNDTLNGGNDNDQIFGGDGRDSLAGEAGDDAIDGGGDNDNIWGGTGNDTIHGGADNDVIGGEAGNDLIFGDAGNDVLWGDAGQDTLYGGDGNDQFFGEVGNDIEIGESGNDSLYGGVGNDRLDGGTGNDLLSGDAGDDWLAGGAGTDRFTGGTGSDTFAFFLGDGRDTIVDFSAASDHAASGSDKIALDVALFGGTAALSQADAFTGMMKFAKDVGSSVVFTFADQTQIVITGHHAADLSQSDFAYFA